MAEDQTRIVISLETVLKNLNRTLRGLDQVKKKLDSIASTRLAEPRAGRAQTNDRAIRSAQQLADQQQRAAVRAQELANRQERARQATERLALSQQRLARAQETVTRAGSRLGAQQDAHVRTFRALEHASQQFNRTLTSLGNALRSGGQALASFGATLAFSVSAPLVALGASIINAATRLDSLQRGLTTMAGSSAAAAEQLERLTRLAKLPGIGFEEAIQGSIRLQAVGFSAAEAEKALRQFSNAIALTGGGREQLENVTVQLGQMAAQSKVLAQDLKPIISSAPAVAVALREAFGTVRSEELQELGVSSKEFISILVSQLETLPRAAAGARNSFENFRDELFRAAAVVGTTVLPALTRLVEVAGPIVTTLANAFAALPAPLQIIVAAFTALLAIAGPVVFVVGQLTLATGRLLVSFAQLNATGILPTIASLRALTVGTLGAAAAQRTLAATSALVAGGIGLLLTAVAAVVTGFALYKAFQKDSVTLSREQVNALDDQIKGLRDQVKFIDSLAAGVERTADEQQRLLEIYEGLNTQGKIRVTSITDEEKRLAELRAELEKIIELREREREQQTAALAAQLAGTLQQIEANERSRQSIAGRVQANTELANSIEREGKITAETARVLEQRGISVAQVEAATFALRKENENLIAKASELINKHKELNGTAKEQAAVLQSLGVRTEEQARQVLAVAANMGLFKGRIDDAIPTLRQYIDFTDQAANSTDKFNRSLSENERRLNEAAERGDAAAKRRRTLIQSAATVARESSVNFEGALKSIRQMVDAVPELAAALKRESELTGKSLNELLRSALEDAFKGREKDSSGTGLRNAQQQLADALTQIALAQKDREVEIELDKNAALLRATEVGHRLRILSLQEYLETRADLATKSLDAEIDQQQRLVTAASLAQARLLKAAQEAGIPAAERTRRQAQATQAQEEAIRAETRLIVLQNQRERIQAELTQEIKLAQDQQLKDTRQLEIQFAELQGKIQAAMEVAVAEEFREALEDLGKSQDYLNKQIIAATKLRQADRVAELERARNLNQRQIEAINNTVRQRTALAELAAAEKLAENAKQRQQRLEADLAFQVEFRGLSEEQAIARRLEGEKRLQASIELSKSIITDLQQRLVALGVAPPPQLQEFIDNLKKDLLGLTELTFTQQFQLAEKKFNHINDERLRRIADIERAVNNRNIAEAEGLLLIRRINGEYVGDLERQLALLKEIATRSNDASLQRQAQSAEETVKDANDRLADFGKQLRSTSIDALRSSFIDFFQSLRDNTVSAKDKLLDLIDSVVARINEVIAENLFDEFMKSLFGDGETAGGGIIASVKRFFGFGGEQESSGAGVANILLESTQAGAALTTGATAAATALTTGGTAAGTTLAASVTAAAGAFAAAIAAAGAAFAATVAAASASQVIQSGAAAARFIGGGASGLFPAVPGGMYKFVEGGYPEAVITTDPQHAARQVSILRELIAKTRGFYGRVHIPELAIGGIVSRETAEANLLSSINRAPQVSPRLPDAALESASGAGAMNLRIVNQVASRELARPYLTSEEGTYDLLNFISRNSNEIVRRLPIRGR